MDIAFCIDDGYVQHCGVLMTSIFENNRGLSIAIHIATTELSERGEQQLRGVAQRYGQSVSVYRVEREMLGDCELREGTHVSLAAYNKILLAELLPVSVERVLYLDCDITVRGSLEELWSVDLEGYSVAACVDMGADSADNYSRLGYDRELGYFNSGVMLLNLNYWREHGLTAMTMEYISQNQHKFKYNDQDPLNYIQRETKRFLHLRYNAMPGIFHKNVERLGLQREYWSQVEAAAQSPVILHCAARIKAWHVGALYPYRGEYERYQAMSEWAEVRATIKYPGMVAERLLKEVLYALRVVKRPTRRYMKEAENK